ncbi:MULTISPECIES: cold shock domain-containing protein [unclassified Moorena]|uniref:cold shock domain-containing protein n=1 Tax=unclassified Moorena TaxID=2683338 RepID=UPI0013CDBE60|nr:MULTISPECIES: cold shock domain-containing protein [unclassified Moorena]NEO21376.1 cold shock domain-containing protein [Moorena sp. SIO4A5]NEQ60377.1 cold shock domain-containing protein [Moorena sp. SIO4A1]
MKPVLHQGKLITWKDDRGFGFIKPNDGGKDVFLHISALKGASRRPKVGDRILYEQVAEPDGKIRAARASIQGVAPRPLPTKRKPRKRSLLETVLGLVILAAMALFTIEFSPSRSPSPITSSPSPITSSTKPRCMIKGNISVTTGKKLYHLPAMEDYESTVIDPSKGERWFCTESEAIANGWRKAPR